MPLGAHMDRIGGSKLAVRLRPTEIKPGYKEQFKTNRLAALKSTAMSLGYRIVPNEKIVQVSG